MPRDITYKLFIGDDTNGVFNRRFYITPHTELPLKGCVAQFTLQGITKTLTNLVNDEPKQVVFSRAETRNLRCGYHQAKLVVIDPTGRFRTVSNTILVNCTDSVDEVYGDGEHNNIVFSLSMGVDYRLLENQPTINGIKLIGDVVLPLEWKYITGKPLNGMVISIRTDDELRAAVARVVTALGGTCHV